MSIKAANWSRLETKTNSPAATSTITNICSFSTTTRIVHTTKNLSFKMKFASAAILVGLFGMAFATPTHLRKTSRSASELKDLIAAAGGCNANTCFALDGSGSVSSSQFEFQKNFVFDVINAIAGNALETAAVQYGLRNKPISFLTADIDSFFLDLDAARFTGAPRTQVGAGIVWCHRQLDNVPYEANKIVVLGDGRNNLGGSPARRADLFRERNGGKVCVVGVGYEDTRALLDIAGGDPKLVLTVDDYLELADILEELVSQICGITLD